MLNINNFKAALRKLYAEDIDGSMVYTENYGWLGAVTHC